MSLDGTPLVIPKQVKGDPIKTKSLDCGGSIFESATGPFSKCSLGHTHCHTCYNIARRFRKGYTCKHKGF